MPESAVRLRGHAKIVADFRDRIAKILQQEMEWPNENFLPDDPCDIIFFDPTMDLKAGTAIMGIEDFIGHELNGDSLKKMTFLELVKSADTSM